MFEGVPSVPRNVFVRVGWQGVLGLRLAPLDSSNHICGWTIVENDPGTVVMGAGGWLIAARIVIDVTESQATFTTLVRYERPAARAVWATAGIAHRALAPKVLERAARSFARHP